MQESQVEFVGLQFNYLFDFNGINRIAIYFKLNGMLVLLVVKPKKTKFSLFTARPSLIYSFATICGRVSHSAVDSTNVKVWLILSLEKLPGFEFALHERFQYSNNDALLSFVLTRAKRATAAARTQIIKT